MKGKTVLPGSTIGILGGGQLGRMVAIEGKKLGYDIICLDPTANSPCGQVADDQIVAPLDDLAAAVKLAERSDLIIYEFENIGLRVVEELERLYYLPQGSYILGIAQNRTEEKKHLQNLGFPVAPFRVIRNMTELTKTAGELGYPCILKTALGGYDGKGQVVIDSADGLKAVPEMLPSFHGEWVLEKKVDLVREISVIAARKATGETAVYPVAENVHRENILHMTVVPARVSEEVAAEATRLAIKIAEAFQVVGLLAVEFFVTPQGLLINEIAPRPHNSGHYTWDACYVSQFEQLIRAVCGLPLGSTQLMTPVLMVNILGNNLSRVLKQFPEFPDSVKLHLYGKRGRPEAKRKMGHLTIKADRVEQALEMMETII